MGPTPSKTDVLLDHAETCGHCRAWLRDKLEKRGWELNPAGGWSFLGPRNALSANWFVFRASMHLSFCRSSH